MQEISWGHLFSTPHYSLIRPFLIDWPFLQKLFIRLFIRFFDISSWWEIANKILGMVSGEVPSAPHVEPPLFSATFILGSGVYVWWKCLLKHLINLIKELLSYWSLVTSAFISANSRQQHSYTNFCQILLYVVIYWYAMFYLQSVFFCRLHLISKKGHHHSLLKI